VERKLNWHSYVTDRQNLADLIMCFHLTFIHSSSSSYG
jgi:hypothetical protein